MARGTSRTPSQHAYQGAVGRTTYATVHVANTHGELVPTQVVTVIDAVSDPDLAQRLHGSALESATALNTFESADLPPQRLAVPVVYHDPAAELFVLVLDPMLRYREIDERIALYERLRADQATIPAYVRDFVVVHGAAGLRDYLEQRAQAVLQAQRVADGGRELERRRSELDATKGELERRRNELDITKSELARERAEIARERAELARERAEQAAAAKRGEESTDTKPVAKLEASEQPTTIAPAIEFDDETTGSAIIPPGSDPLTTETRDAASTAEPEWLAKLAATSASSIAVVGGVPRLALVAGEQIARGLGGALDIRVVLHRVASYPVIALIVGPPPALRVPSPTQFAIVTLDIADEPSRAVLALLARRFELIVDLVVRGRRLRTVVLTAPLAENVAYIVRAAEDHLRGVSAAGEPSYTRAVELVQAAGYDLLGINHPDAAEFRDDKLAELETAQQLRRAIAIARRYARPSREDYLVCTRGFPLPRWRELRRHVLESAVAWGLWMGPELAQVAVSEGLARSRRDLIGKLASGFDALRANPAAFDIDEDAAADNSKALAEEARALGVTLAAAKPERNGAGAIGSDGVSAVSGSIGGVTPSQGISRISASEVRGRPSDSSVAAGLSIDALIGQLGDRERRVAAALELCDRADPRAAEPVIAAVHNLSRAEAVRVLGMAVKFGPAAKAPLLQGLASSKAFLRHGCALALAMLRTDDGTQAVIDLLLSEPTEIWREVARAVGQVGPPALLPLASTFGRLGSRADDNATERVAWAMAHVAVRGGKPAVEQMASGQSVVAPVARRALELHATAANDQVRVRGGADGSQPGRDVTVNRAFSRRFFEALEQGIPEVGAAALVDLETSQPMEMLDESDLIDDDEELDEADIM